MKTNMAVEKRIREKGREITRAFFLIACVRKLQNPERLRGVSVWCYNPCGTHKLKAASTLLVEELEIQGYYKYKAARALVGRAVGRQSSKCVCRLNIALPKESRKSQPQQGQEGRSEKKAEPLVTTQSRWKQTTPYFTNTVPGKGGKISRSISQTVLEMCWFCPCPWKKFVINFTLVREDRKT